MELLRGIKAVTFDVGGTLIDPWPSVGHVYADVAAERGWRNCDPAVLNRRFAIAWRAKKNFDYTRTAWADLVAKTFHTRAGPEAPVPFFDELYERFAQPDAWHVYEDVQPVLDWLLEHDIELGIISNWDERLRPLLQRLKLDRYFRVIVISHEVGFTKPSATIFEEAARKFTCPASSILHIGDGEAEDVQGARSAGLHALWIDRKGQGTLPNKLRTLNELHGFIDLTVRGA